MQKWDFKIYPLQWKSILGAASSNAISVLMKTALSKQWIWVIFLQTTVTNWIHDDKNDMKLSLLIAVSSSNSNPLQNNPMQLTNAHLSAGHLYFSIITAIALSCHHFHYPSVFISTLLWYCCCYNCYHNHVLLSTCATVAMCSHQKM